MRRPICSRSVFSKSIDALIEKFVRFVKPINKLQQQRGASLSLAFRRRRSLRGSPRTDEAAQPSDTRDNARTVAAVPRRALESEQARSQPSKKKRQSGLPGLNRAPCEAGAPAAPVVATTAAARNKRDARRPAGERRTRRLCCADTGGAPRLPPIWQNNTANAVYTRASD